MPGKNLAAIMFQASLACVLGASQCFAGSPPPDDLKGDVDAIIEPLMREQDIAGMAVAVLVDGKAHYFNYGVASKTDNQNVIPETLFEIGSLSKVFTSTLAGYAVAQGKLSLAEKVTHYVPQLRGSAFEHVSVLNLGTYTAGGLPLQFPKEADSKDRMIAYYQDWKPSFIAGEQRLYSNPSLGLFGYVAARSLGQPFEQLMEETLFPKLGLQNSYIKVPDDQMAHYAQGYSKDNTPTRVGPGAMDAEAYGMKTTATDLMHFIQLTLKPDALEPSLQQAIALTRTGYYQTGPFSQSLGWELYPYPLKLDALLEGNSPHMALEPHAAHWFKTPVAPTAQQLINKTGSTNGFGAYIAYVPAKNLGIVLLANKNYPIAARVKAAYEVLSAVGGLNAAHL
jgi:beta-lactamase class C